MLVCLFILLHSSCCSVGVHPLCDVRILRFGICVYVFFVFIFWLAHLQTL